MSRVATLQEVETWYSLDDLMDLHDAMDAQEEAQRLAHKKGSKGGK